MDEKLNCIASVHSPHAYANTRCLYASFKRKIFEDQGFPLDYWAGFTALRIPGVAPESFGLDKDYMACVRRELEKRGMLHFFRRGPKRGTCVVTASVPTERKLAQQFVARRSRVIPLEELAQDQFTVSAAVLERCVEVYHARFGKTVFGAYAMLAQQDRAKWTAEEMMQLWDTSKSVTYRLIKALGTLGFLKKRKTVKRYEFIPEKAYRVAFEERITGVSL